MVPPVPVHVPKMTIQHKLVLARSLAIGACHFIIGQPPSWFTVSALVLIPVIRATESFKAQSTLVRFHSSVNHNMRIQSLLLLKLSAALPTLERGFIHTVISGFVIRQINAVFEDFWAFWALNENISVLIKMSFVVLRVAERF